MHRLNSLSIALLLLVRGRRGGTIDGLVECAQVRKELLYHFGVVQRELLVDVCARVHLSDQIELGLVKYNAVWLLASIEV